MSLRLEIDEMKYSKMQNALIENLSMTISKGEIISILGPSGIGKTTILRIMAGLETGYKGIVHYNGTAVLQPSRKIQMMFQDDRLFPWLTVYENIEFAFSHLSKVEKNKKVSDSLNQMELQSKANSWPSELSGGEVTRIALARALAGKPEVLLLDEPFGNLDLKLKDEIRRILLNSVKTSSTTLIMVTHNIDDAITLSDRVFVLKKRPISDFQIVPINMSHPRLMHDIEFRTVASELANDLTN